MFSTDFSICLTSSPPYTRLPFPELYPSAMSSSLFCDLPHSVSCTHPSLQLLAFASALSFASIISIQGCISAIWNAFPSLYCMACFCFWSSMNTEDFSRIILVFFLFNLNLVWSITPNNRLQSLILFHLPSDQLKVYEGLMLTHGASFPNWCVLFTEAVMWVIGGTACNLKWQLNDLVLLQSFGTVRCDTSSSHRSTSWAAIYGSHWQKGRQTVATCCRWTVQ